MEIVHGILYVIGIMIVVMFVLKISDVFMIFYHNKAMPMIRDAVNNISEQISGMPVNTSDYDVYGIAKPYFKALDVALVIAFLSAIAGVFIVVKNRT